MFRLRPEYVPSIVRARRSAGVVVGVLPCPSDSTKCTGDRPTGAITMTGYAVLAIGPILGAALGCAIASNPLAGAAVLGVLGGALVLPPWADGFGMRKMVCCSDNGHWEEQP